MPARRLALLIAFALVVAAVAAGWLGFDSWRPHPAGATRSRGDDAGTPSASEPSTLRSVPFDGTLRVTLRCDAGLPRPASIRLSLHESLRDGGEGDSFLLVTTPADSGEITVTTEPGETSRYRAAL